MSSTGRKPRGKTAAIQKVGCRLNAGELKVFISKVKESGLSIAEYIRSNIL